MLLLLRDGFDLMDIRLKAWSGPGSAAGALLRKCRVPQNHYPAESAPDEIKATWIKVEMPKPLQAPFIAGSEFQDAAHAGHIELLQQGFHHGVLSIYDIISAYPAACIDLSSMRDGQWIKHDGPFRHLPKHIDDFDRLSLFKVRMRLKPGVMLKNEDGIKRPHPFSFFPLPMRVAEPAFGLGKGSILFPHELVGWFTRDDVAALYAWLSKFDPRQKESRVDFYEALEFVPGNDTKPFVFIKDLFKLRADIKAHAKATGIYNAAEMCIKLCLNSIYGKCSEKVGSRGKPPICANPWYAAAITSTVAGSSWRLA
jgi:hypothetical protein